MRGMKKGLLVLCCSVLMASQMPNTQSAEAKSGNPDRPQLAANIVSDNHFSGGRANFITALKDMQVMNPNADVLVNNGDFVNGGSQAEYDDIKKTVDAYPHPANVFYGMGNHELYTVTRTWAANPLETPEVAFQRYKDFVGEDKTWFEKVVNGYPFLFIGTDVFHASDEVELSQEQMEWLEKRLKFYSNKKQPIFVFAHQPFKNTVPSTRNGELPNYGGSYSNQSAITSLLGKYPNVIVFSGHTHQHLDQDDWALKTDYGFYAVNTGGIVDTWKLVKDSSGKTSEVWNGSSPQGIYMEAFEDKVVIKGRDYKKASFIREFVIPLQVKKTAEEVAADITEIKAPKKNDEQLRLPTVPKGFSIAIKSVTPANVIGLDGAIVQPDTDTKVTLVLEITRTVDGTTAETAPLGVTVPAKDRGNNGHLGNGNNGNGNHNHSAK